MLVPTGHDDGSAALLLKSTCAVCGAEIQYRSGMSLDFTMDFFVVRFTVCKIDHHIFSCFLTRTSPKEDAAVCHTHSFTNSLLESGFAGRGCWVRRQNVYNIEAPFGTYGIEWSQDLFISLGWFLQRAFCLQRVSWFHVMQSQIYDVRSVSDVPTSILRCPNPGRQGRKMKQFDFSRLSKIQATGSRTDNLKVSVG